jgi:hypothetical protein
MFFFMENSGRAADFSGTNRRLNAENLSSRGRRVRGHCRRAPAQNFVRNGHQVAWPDVLGFVRQRVHP